MASLSPWEHTMIGAFAGMTEVTIMQPTVAIKNALQEGRPLPRTPVAFYRGLAVSVLDTLSDDICCTQIFNRMLRC